MLLLFSITYDRHYLDVVADAKEFAKKETKKEEGITKILLERLVEKDC